jgi:hypothetical protein
MGTIARAHSSPASIAARKTVAEIGEFVGNSTTAQAFENGIIAYAQAAIELDLQLLERVRGEICSGLDAFDRVAEILKTYPGKEKQVRSMSLVFLAHSYINVRSIGTVQDFIRAHKIPRAHCGAT